MNNIPSSSRPRLMCRLVRSRHAEPDTDASWASRHAENCEDCATYYAALESVADELSSTAPRNSDTVPAGLEDRIWAAVEADPTIAFEPAKAPRHQVTHRWTWGLASATVLAAVLMWSNWGGVSADPIVAQTDFDEQGMRALVTQIGDLSAEWFVVTESDSTGLEAGALSQELDALEADASAALRFLQRSFLPTPESAS